MSGQPEEELVTLYEAVGGMPFFERLVDAFYEGVVTDPVLWSLYPPDDLAGADVQARVANDRHGTVARVQSTYFQQRLRRIRQNKPRVHVRRTARRRVDR